MEQPRDFMHMMRSRFDSMSKGQKHIASFIMNDYDKAAFMTASKLGEKAGVSESTVVRFALEMGYDGYPHLQKALQEFIRNRLTSVQRVEMISSMRQDNVLRTVLRADIGNIRATIEKIDSDMFTRVVDKFDGARKVYVLGMRSSAPLAAFLGYYLSYMLDNVQALDSVMSDIFEQLVHIGPQDLLVGISFPRYSTRTVRGLQFARERGAQIVALTDSMSSPLASLADHCLIANVDINSFVDSIVAPMSLINALIVALGIKRKQDVFQRFLNLESIWTRYNVYDGHGAEEDK